MKNRVSSAPKVATKTVSYALDGSTESMSHMRKMISKHMIQSRDTSVHVYSTSEIDVTDIVEFRNANKDAFMQRHQTSLTYTPFFIDSVINRRNYGSNLWSRSPL